MVINRPLYVGAQTTQCTSTPKRKTQKYARPPAMGLKNSITVYIGFCNYGFSVQSGYSDRNPVYGPLSLHNSNLGFNDLQFRSLCSNTATVNTFGRRYTQRNIVCTGFSNHLVVKPSKNPLNLATTFGFSDLEPCDRDKS